MGCNWELFELRVVIYGHFDTNAPTNDIWWQFFNVAVDLKTLSMPNFQGSGSQCNFRQVFSQLAGLKMIPFSFPQETYRSDRLNFGNLEAAGRNNVKLSAIRLYVHRRDQADNLSLSTGTGVLLKTVMVDFTAPKPLFYAQVSGADATVVN